MPNTEWAPESISQAGLCTRSLASLTALVDSSENPFWSVDPNGRLLAFNRAAASLLWMLGVPAELGALAFNRSHADQVALWPSWFARALADGPFRVEHLLPDGRWLELAFRPVLDHSTVSVVITATDITRLKYALDELRANRTLLEETEALALAGSSTWDVETDTTIWSAGLYRITGRDPSVPPPSRAERPQLYTQESWERLDAAVQHALATGEPYDLEVEIVRPDRSLRWARACGAAIRDPQGRITQLFGTLQDISTQKLSEARLRESEKLFRATFEQAAVGIVHTAFDGRFLRCNPRFAEIIGYPLEEVPGLSFRQITAQEDLEESISTVQRLVAANSGTSAWERRYCRKDGAFTWIRVTLSFLSGDDGKPAHFLGVVEDINDRKLAEDTLRAAEQRFRDIFAYAPEGIFQTQPDGKPLALNPAAARLLGYDSVPAALSAMTHAESDVWLNSADYARYVSLLETEGYVRNFQCQLKRRDGTPIWIAITAQRISDPDGKTLYQGFNQDITEQKRLEEKLTAHIREIQLLSEINNARLHAKSEKDLLADYCRIIVEVGGYRMAWVGFAQHTAGKPVVPVAFYGHEDGYLGQVRISWSDVAVGRGVTGRALRTGKIQVTEDFNADPRVQPWRDEALRRGYRSSIALPFQLSDGTMASLTAYSPSTSIWTDSERRLMEQIALDLGFGINTLRNEIAKNRYEDDLRYSLEQTIQVIAETVDQRDPYTSGHQRRVADLCLAIGRQLDLSDERIHGLHLGASIHDLGKIGIPLELLAKPGRLSRAQFDLIKEHVELGYAIIKDITFPWPIGEIILQHHERLDGSGYPRGLTADQIILEARIVAVADVVEAMSSHRPYRVAPGINLALTEIESQRGRFYDAAVVDACLRLFRAEGYKFPD